MALSRRPRLGERPLQPSRAGAPPGRPSAAAARRSSAGSRAASASASSAPATPTTPPAAAPAAVARKPYRPHAAACTCTRPRRLWVQASGARGRGNASSPGHAGRLLRQCGGGGRAARARARGAYPRAHPQASQVVDAQRKVGQTGRHRHGRARARAARERVRRGRVVRGALAPQQPGGPRAPLGRVARTGCRGTNPSTILRRAAPRKKCSNARAHKGIVPARARFAPSIQPMRTGHARRDPLVHLNSPDMATQRYPAPLDCCSCATRNMHGAAAAMHEPPRGDPSYTDGLRAPRGCRPARARARAPGAAPP
jgi:hypothetical protein